MSQFYDQASLVMVPSGYKAGKVYSQKPLTTDGQLTFTRTGDTATRVNADGLVEKVRTNKVLYSEAFENASWAKSGLTVTANTVANPLTGTLTADKLVTDAATNFHYLGQSITYSAGEATASVYVKAAGYDWFVIDCGITNVYAYFNVNSGSLGSKGSACTSSIVSVGNGWYRCSLIYTATASAFSFNLSVRNADGGGSFLGDGVGGCYAFGAQVEQGVVTQYIETTSAAVSVGPVANLPRIDYTGGGCGKLILESQRTNLVTYSEQLNNAAWTNNSLITPNSTTSPDGYENADLLTTGASLYFIAQQPTVTTSPHTFSIYAKKGNWDIFRIGNYSSGTNVAFFDLTNGTTGNVLGGTSEIINVGGGWYRCIYTATVPVNTSNTVFYAPSISMGTVAAPPTGSTMYFWGAQVEAGSYATSYIGPTLGAAVTRGFDMVGKSAFPTSILNTTTAHSGFFELKPNAIESNASQVFGFDNGSYSSYIKIYPDLTGRHRLVIASGGSSGASAYGVANQYNKFAWSYDGAGNVKLFCNGVASANYSITLAAMTVFGAGEKSLQTNYTSQSFKQILLFNSKLTDAQLIELTTL